jgi:hypothetical protein
VGRTQACPHEALGHPEAQRSSEALGHPEATRFASLLTARQEGGNSSNSLIATSPGLASVELGGAFASHSRI